jgi:hypothetical protein
LNVANVKYVLLVLCLFSVSAKIAAQTGRHLHAQPPILTRS